MGNVNSSNGIVVRNGDWEHQICWADTAKPIGVVRKNSESSSVQTFSDEQHSYYDDGGRDTPSLLTRDEMDSSGRRGGPRGGSLRRSLRQAKSVIKDKTEAAASTCATSPYKRQASEGSVCYGGAELNNYAVTNSVKSTDEVELSVMDSSSIRTMSTYPGGSPRELTPIHI